MINTTAIRTVRYTRTLELPNGCLSSEKLVIPDCIKLTKNMGCQI